MNGLWSQIIMSFTPDEGDNKCLAKSKSDRRAGEQNSENREAKLSPHKYPN